MTKERYDEHSTEFGLWLRKQPRLSSNIIHPPLLLKISNPIQSRGYVTTNLDYVWYCYSDREIMLLEEKRYLGEISESQEEIYSIVDTAMRFACENKCEFNIMRSPTPVLIKYYGYHVIKFSKTNPEDGYIELDGIEITKEQLIQFLKFKWMPDDNGTKTNDAPLNRKIE